MIKQLPFCFWACVGVGALNFAIVWSQVHSGHPYVALATAGCAGFNLGTALMIFVMEKIQWAK